MHANQIFKANTEEKPWREKSLPKASRLPSANPPSTLQSLCSCCDECSLRSSTKDLQSLGTEKAASNSGDRPPKCQPRLALSARLRRACPEEDGRARVSRGRPLADRARVRVGAALLRARAAKLVAAACDPRHRKAHRLLTDRALGPVCGTCAQAFAGLNVGQGAQHIELLLSGHHAKQFHLAGCILQELLRVVAVVAQLAVDEQHRVVWS
mmetsp:Transcript_5596/g.12195  ORF Transcript_5596/g.12195 Transcript_5596/m.12195 type:complete len:211 (-) Transcript_5596:885-1517(-)